MINMVETSPVPNDGESALQLLKRGDLLRLAVLKARRHGKSVGLVPTMGALHEGHLSLVEASARENDVTVVTIFVNPTQFNDTGDLNRYPHDLETDLALLATRGCDLVFTPSVEEIYRPGHETYVEVGPVGERLEGAHRPGHFRGVATVVLKLFQLAPADRAYFGRKDYQQTLVVQRMALDFDLPVEIRVCPTVREPDGLAMSSRNARLSEDERRRAPALSQSLDLAAKLAESGERDAQTIIDQMQADIDAVGGVALEYLTLVAEGTVRPVDRLDGPTVALVAARVGKTRLIDNRMID